MSLQDRIESLRARHAALDTAIESETRRPLPDESQIADLKRKKLRIKDELLRFGTGNPH
ncbi:YdcH family protein [Magnetospirillum sulfuroxidans]|uniref:YdcH family protein n=1 Tax=Magnetospirillum sulfuroxidans TaxID=611300 RepID=A0ABS5ICB9_9PROT|nr:YdcH family protein [Magnetospirillum sulfuroxidans]MBR9972073.1 YdcH family protein [Magnetospirillum sulfuroxidans]